MLVTIAHFNKYRRPAWGNPWRKYLHSQTVSHSNTRCVPGYRERGERTEPPARPYPPPPPRRACSHLPQPPRRQNEPRAHANRVSANTCSLSRLKVKRITEASTNLLSPSANRRRHMLYKDSSRRGTSPWALRWCRIKLKRSMILPALEAARARAATSTITSLLFRRWIHYKKWRLLFWDRKMASSSPFLLPSRCRYPIPPPLFSPTDKQRNISTNEFHFMHP